MSYDSFIAIAAMVAASIGVLITSYVIFVFIKFRDTPVVRASGKVKMYTNKMSNENKLNTKNNKAANRNIPTEI